MHADGTPHEMTRLATKFAERLKRRYNLPVGFADERLTSVDAESRLREAGKKFGGHNSKSAKPLLDAVAAQLILETWFESPHHVIPA
jgi:putative Holliday junction resolvase